MTKTLEGKKKYYYTKHKQREVIFSIHIIRIYNSNIHKKYSSTQLHIHLQTQEEHEEQNTQIFVLIWDTIYNKQVHRYTVFISN